MNNAGKLIITPCFLKSIMQIRYPKNCDKRYLLVRVAHVRGHVLPEEHPGACSGLRSGA